MRRGFHGARGHRKFQREIIRAVDQFDPSLRSFVVLDAPRVQAERVFAKVHNAIFDPLRERFTIEIIGKETLMTMGKVIWAQYDILRGQKPIAKISKQFSWIGRDQYVVDVLQGEDDCLLLAVTVVIDMMVSNGR